MNEDRAVATPVPVRVLAAHLIEWSAAVALTSFSAASHWPAAACSAIAIVSIGRVCRGIRAPKSRMEVGTPAPAPVARVDDEPSTRSLRKVARSRPQTISRTIDAGRMALEEADTTIGPLLLAHSAERLISDFSDDPDLTDILGEFVILLGERAKAMSKALKEHDLKVLGRLAHQLKGAAGGYGFPSITAHAKSVEDALAPDGDASSLRSAVESLCALCDRAAIAPPSVGTADH